MHVVNMIRPPRLFVGCAAGLLLSMCLATGTFAQTTREHANVSPTVAEGSHEIDRPVLPGDAAPWAGTMLIIIVSMFFMAAVIGPIVRAEMPQEAPVPHGHDPHDAHGHDDHGHSHGH